MTCAINQSNIALWQVRQRDTMYDKLMRIVGIQIRFFQRKTGTSTVKLAEEVGVTTGTILAYTRGEVNISVFNLLKIAEVLGVSILKLFDPKAIKMQELLDAKLLEDRERRRLLKIEAIAESKRRRALKEEGRAARKLKKAIERRIRLKLGTEEVVSYDLGISKPWSY